MKQSRFTMELIEASIGDIDQVGGKNASLGEMLQQLTPLGVKVPDGFIVTSAAYFQFIKDNQLDQQIRDILQQLDITDLQTLYSCGEQIRGLIQKGHFSNLMEKEILDAYQKLIDATNFDKLGVAVRSSATAEDLPDASFAGQQDTYLNIRGAQNLLMAIKNCFASLFTDRAISYRESFQFGHFNIGLSVCIQKMVRSDMGVSGVAFSIDTESGFKDAVIINGSYGLGELIVQGAINPDEFIVYKPLLKKGYPALIEKKLGHKQQKMIYGTRQGTAVEVIQTPDKDTTRFCLTNNQVLQLSKWVMIIEDYYTRLKGKWCPMDIEWAVDGITGELFIVQARPETIHSLKELNYITEYRINDASRASRVLLRGIAVGDKIAFGKVHNLKGIEKSRIHEINFLPGDIMVTEMTDPDWEPIMKKAAAIITNKGGRTCHAAIVARELGVPAIVGCDNATEILITGKEITVSCAEGEAGIIYDGRIWFTKYEHQLSELPEVRTPVMMNIGSPDIAFQYASYPAKGVGLAREEFIINNYIKIHPMALLKHRSLNDAALSSHVQAAIAGYEDEENYFIEKLSFGIAKIAAAYYPNQVIVRFSDFKTNEYYNMPGGKYFEPGEENPMIGWRGASRYYADAYKEAFGMECKAIKKVREVMGLDNVVVMIPFCRTVDELLLVQSTMSEFGLTRGENGLEIYLMAEVPSNVILAEQFAKHIDGFSIGSNDLTQLVLGLDRDSSLVANLYNERNDAVKIMISNLIKSAKKMHVKVGICGQGPSDYPDFAQFLVENGIDSISVTPDSFMKTVMAVKEIEDKLTTVVAPRGVA
ncbi:phosphoenolpyruvate synthase [Pedobacter sp. HDW13]|uniref:phosphoenolpyruvate synthase n=1 Tax=unclassified Pedobacter TaxID=2628915 RepID=UPI000F5B3398|nr:MULTISPECIES: phosphoenolpyruvate synthase [unclassified Pedobacter]QIL37997.1 phosphoenolpyruvate synthase [Pedobacter sp. HDW13]RQO68966.1 phosphoenolpyruvate synthase [Pedobacter sp. KBW01]